MKTRFLLCGLLALQSCTTVQSITVNQIPTKDQRQNKIKAEGSSPVIVGIPFGSGYVDESRQDFIRQCSSGRIEGTVTKTFSKNYFLGLFLTQNVSFEGYCVQKIASADVESPKAQRAETSRKTRSKEQKRMKQGRKSR